MSEWHENLKVHYDRPGSTTDDVERTAIWVVERTPAQKHTDHALDQAENDALEARRLVTSAVDWLAAVNGGQLKNRDAATYVTKLIEEIAEVRRARG